jgi:hypothetical protein
MSRCYFRCIHCSREGNRSETFKARPKACPSFTDECPSCRSQDVEVMTPEGARSQHNGVRA